MAKSYEKINYSLRPAKTVERKMICESLRRLHSFAKIETYKYVGFGSTYFSDFQLFHRALGINDMLSIEKDVDTQERFEFNKPYQCVRLDFRSSSEVLSELDLQARAILWLDYDGKLEMSILSDIDTVCSKVSSGSVLIVSVNVTSNNEPEEADRKKYTSETGLSFDKDIFRLHEFSKRVGDCSDVKGSDLRGKGLAKISRQFIQNTIESALSDRNGVLSVEKKLYHRQIFNFHYSDGAKMLTVGWLIFEENDREKLNACSFNELHFVRDGEEAYVITVPCLTLNEMRYLNAHLPLIGASTVTLSGVPPSDIEQYAKLYRYFPIFTEAVFT